MCELYAYCGLMHPEPIKVSLAQGIRIWYCYWRGDKRDFHVNIRINLDFFTVNSSTPEGRSGLCTLTANYISETEFWVK